jgi:hypothetical protein
LSSGLFALLALFIEASLMHASALAVIHNQLLCLSKRDQATALCAAIIDGIEHGFLREARLPCA